MPLNNASNLALALLTLACVGGCNAAPKSEPSSCPVGQIGSDANGRISASDQKKLISAVNNGAKIRVKVTLLAADKDSTNTEVWFEPVSISVLNSIVYAESPALKWPPSRYSGYNEDTAVGAISLRASSDGKLALVQENDSAKSEGAAISWCLS